MKNHLKILATLVLVLTFAVTSTAFAQEGSATPQCTGETVSGQVVAADAEAGVITISTADGLCTVAAEGGIEHPVAALLGTYFSNISLDDLQAALSSTTGSTVYNEETGEWQWVEEGTEGAVTGNVLEVVDNGDGTYTVYFTVDGLDEPQFFVTDDPELAAALNAGLEAQQVDWDLQTDGEGNITILDAGGEIEAYHEDGMGFGVLTKLYAMVADAQAACAAGTEEGEEAPANCDLTVQELVDAFKSGTGLGLLYKEYGKPGMTGVGHVYKELGLNPGKAKKEMTTDDEDGTARVKPGKEDKVQKDKPDKPDKPDKDKGKPDKDKKDNPNKPDKNK
jgi:hypothetical protein